MSKRLKAKTETNGNDLPASLSDESVSRDARWLNRFRRSVLAWYRKHGRHLPWRESADPYRVWISEIMLQQTTVTAVVPYFERFLKRFPTLSALADANEEDVLHAWEGLGYYSRARNLHRAAGIIMQEHDGKFPDNVQTLQTLPGIGRYTAGAIASFAFGQRAPIVEANTLRLHSRLLGYRDNPKSSRGQSLLWEFAETILPTKDAGAFNQALMDLGASVCVPEHPQCIEKCPLKSQCLAFDRSEQHEIPALAARPTVTATIEAVVVVGDGERILLHRRPAGARWAGLWDFPRYELGIDTAPERPLSPRQRSAFWREAENAFHEQWQQSLIYDGYLTEIVHHVTRYRIRLLCFRATWLPGSSLSDEQLSTHRGEWVHYSQLPRYAMPVSGRKIANLLMQRGTTT